MWLYPTLFPSGVYHLLARAVGDENLFRQEQDYHTMVWRLRKYLLPIADIYAYNFLPDHFHLFLGIKEFSEISSLYESRKNGWVLSPISSPCFIMQQFSNMLNSYVKSLNFRYHRNGGLFIDYIRREEIFTNDEFCSTVFKVHQDPVHHGYCEDMRDWRWSSVHSYFGRCRAMVSREEVIRRFGGRKAFLLYHKKPICSGGLGLE